LWEAIRGGSSGGSGARLVPMSVEANAITCDGHHPLPVVLVVPEVSVRFVTPARVRTYAHARG